MDFILFCGEIHLFCLSLEVSESGLSQMICLPASAVAIAISACALFSVQISTTSISGLLIMLCQSVENDSKASFSFASFAISVSISMIIFLTGIAGAGQKNIGIPAYAIDTEAFKVYYKKYRI